MKELLGNGEPSFARCLYWSRMKVVSFCFEKKIYIKKRNDIAFQQALVAAQEGERRHSVRADQVRIPGRTWLFQLRIAFNLFSLCFFIQTLHKMMSRLMISGIQSCWYRPCHGYGKITAKCCKCLASEHLTVATGEKPRDA